MRDLGNTTSHCGLRQSAYMHVRDALMRCAPIDTDWDALLATMELDIREDETERTCRYLESLIVDQRLCPPRAWLRDWNRSIERIVEEVQTLD